MQKNYIDFPKGQSGLYNKAILFHRTPNCYIQWHTRVLSAHLRGIFDKTLITTGCRYGIPKKSGS